MVVAAALRVFRIDHSFWLDEVFTYQAISGHLADVFRSPSNSLSFLLPHLTLKLGDHETFVRLPSLIAGILTVGGVYWLGRSVHSVEAGLCAALLVAVSPYHINYSQEARYYALFTLFAVLALQFLARVALNPTRKNWLTLVAIVACGSFTHLFFVAFIGCAAGALFLYQLFSRLRARESGSSVVSLVIPGLGIAAGLLPYLCIKIVNMMQPLQPMARPEDIEKYKFAPQEYLFYLREHLDILNQLPGTSFKAVILIVSGLFGFVWLVRNRSLYASIFAGGSFLLIAPLLYYTANHWYASRYFIGQLPIFYVLIGIGIVVAAEGLSGLLSKHKLSGRTVSALSGSVIALLLVLQIPHLRHYYKVDQDRFNWREIAEHVTSYFSPDDVVVFFTSRALDLKRHPYAAYEPPGVTLGFYMRRAAPVSRPDMHEFSFVRVARADEMTSYVLANRNRNVWLVHEPFHPSIRLPDSYRRLFQPVFATERAELRVLGKPTRNLVVDPGFELENVGLMEANALTRDSFAGAHSLELAPDKSYRVPTTEPLEFRQKTYSLSFAVSYKDIPWSHTNDCGHVSLVGLLPDGTSLRVLLAEFKGSRPWHRRAFNLRPQALAALSEVEELKIEIGSKSRRGILRIDNIQVEEEPHPTPFVDGVRPPHAAAMQAALRD